MALAAMSRIELFGLHRDLPAVMDLLQRSAVIEVEASELDAGSPDTTTGGLEREIAELERLLGFFDRLAPRRPNLIEQFAGIKTVLTEREFADYAADAGGVAEIAGRARTIEAEMSAATGRLHELEALTAQLRPWRLLELTRAELEGTKHVRLLLGLVEQMPFARFAADVLALEGRALPILIAGVKEQVRVAVLWPRENADPQSLDWPAFNQVNLPAFTGRIDEAIDTGEAESERVRAHLHELQVQAVQLAKERQRIEARLDHLRNELAKAEALHNLTGTKHAFKLAGWIPSGRIAALRASLTSTGHPVAMSTRSPEPGEDVPVVMSNPDVISPFEALVQSFSTPKYGEIDPTRITAPFFFLFFGFCLSDVGYGAVLILFCLGLMKWLKMGPVGKQLARLFIYGSIGAIFMGLVTGSVFGDLLGFRSLIDPILNALTLLGLALGLGVVQLFVGIIISALPSLKQGQWRDAFFNQLVWLLFLSSVMLLLGKGPIYNLLASVMSFLGLKAATSVGFGKFLNYFALAATMGVIYNATRGKKGLIKKLLAIPAGLFNIYNSIGFFSDVLSYSRLMALGMSGGVMASIINLFARMVAGIEYAGIPLAILIGVFGHALNIALSILGAYVHSSRLQFLEFYGKFFEGGGRPFKPLRLNQKYTFVIK